jgi:hypothetical protein
MYVNGSCFRFRALQGYVKLRFRVYNLGLRFSVKDLGGYVCTLRFTV